MKNTLLAIAFAISTAAIAQTPVVKDIKANMTQGMQPGVEVFIAGANEDQVEDAIKDNTKKFKGKDRKIKKSDERFIDDAEIKELSPNTIDIHYLIKEESNGVTLQLFFNMGLTFLSKDLDSQKYDFMSRLAGKIAMDATQLNYDELIKEQEKVLEDFMDDNKDASNNISKAQNDIEKAKKEIAEKENEIKELERKISEGEKKIATQQRVVNELKDKKAKVRK